MLSSSPLTRCCISLLVLQLLHASPAEEHSGASRLDILNKLFDLDDDTDGKSRSQTDIGGLGTRPASRVRFSARLAWARPVDPEDPATEHRAARARRHAHLGSRGGHHHAQMMRVGCVLGTCQVQNLSHRLYQLVGQSGREESSPINPRSPHSYG